MRDRSSRILKTTWAILPALVWTVLALGTAPPAAADERRVAEAEVAFAYGLEAYHGGDLEEAESRLRRAVEADPEHGGAWYWLGLVQLTREEGEEAVGSLHRALEAKTPPPVERSRVQQDLEAARRASATGATPSSPGYRGEVLSLFRLPRWEARLGLAVGDDSNPALVPDGVLVDLGDGTSFVGEESDTVTNLDLRFEVHPFYDQGGWSLGLGVEGRQALYSDLDALDFRRARAFVHLAWGGDPAGYLVGPQGFTRVPVGHRRLAVLFQGSFVDDALDGDSFRDGLALSTTLHFREGRGTATQLDLSFEDQELDGGGAGPFDPDGEVTALAVSQWFWFAGRDGYLRLGARRAERDAGRAFDSETDELWAELAVPLGQRWVAFLEARQGEEDFDNVESNLFFPGFLAQEPRQDETDRYSAALQWAATPRLWLLVRATRIERDTDLGPAVAGLVDLSWERDVVSLGLRWFVAGGQGSRGGAR